MSDNDKKAPEAKPEDDALQKRVEMIMGERNADGVTPAPRKKLVSDDDQPAIDIFKDPKTAPAVSAELLKQIGADPKQPAKPAAAAAKPDPAVSEPTAEPAPEAPEPPAELDDAETDEAVDDIVVNEADTVLAAEDAAAGKAAKDVKAKSASSASSDWKAKLKHLFKNKWFWAGLVAFIVIILAIPYTRYTVLGLFIKESVAVTVTDSKTHTPVSNAAIKFGGVVAKTDANGKTTMKVPVGQQTLSVTKQYYQSYSTKYSVGLKSGQTSTVSLVATGRQVPITVVNKISGKPVAGAEITVLDTTAKTDSKGKAIIVLPTSKATETATVSLTGYNTTHAAVQVTDQVVAANTFTLTPAGKVYFLSNSSGKLDIVKSNLDGTGRQVVLAGTGKEDPDSTSLLASRDWHYLVLKAQRDTPQASLYIIDTSNDKVTNFDNGNADFTLIGWYNHNFLYQVTRNTVSSWQAAHEVIKSYAADSGQLNLIDQNQAEGTASSYAYQNFYNFYIVDGLLIYNTQWYTYTTSGFGYDLTGKTDTIRGIQANGQGKKDYQTFPAPGVSYIQAALYEPQGVYYAVYNYNDNKTTYYKYENQAVTIPTNLNQATFNKAYPTYLLSPTGSQTFWTELRDGKNTLFIGNSDAGNQKQIASLSEYSPYGWYTDSYVLVSKKSSELYIMPVTGLSGTEQPIKITDYYKPAQSYAGYGYGYGGL